MQEITATRTIDYTDVMIKKPWGYEYLMYQNDEIGIWLLHIKYNKQTSLHCHPKKKTGLILLSGNAEISFLNNSIALNSLSKLMIRPGLFHSTKASSINGVFLIEAETPPDKVNLVRLDDEYGREQQPYEGKNAQIPIIENCIKLDIPDVYTQSQYKICGCSLIIENIDDIAVLTKYSPDDIILVIKGGIYSNDNEPLLSQGDVVTRNTIDRLAGSFNITNSMTFMVIKKE